MEITSAPAWDQEAQGEDNTALEAELLGMWDIGVVPAQIPTPAGQMSCQQIRSVTGVTYILIVMKRLCNSG